MARTATQASPRLIALALPGIPGISAGSAPACPGRARLARAGRVRARTPRSSRPNWSPTRSSTPAIDGTKTIGVILTHAGNPAAVTVAVSDSSPQVPVRRDTPAGSEQGRGLQIVEALSAHWGWRCEDGGKVVFAVLAREA